MIAFPSCTSKVIILNLGVRKIRVIPLLTDQGIAEVTNLNFDSYAWTRHRMGEFLWAEGKSLQAIRLFLEASILALNGARDTGLPWQKGLRIPPYDLSFASNPLDAKYLALFVKDGVVTPEQLLNLFQETWRNVPARSQLPLSRDATWGKLVEEIRKNS